MMAASKKSIRPSVENRAEAVERLWSGPRAVLPQAREYLARRSAREESYFRARDAVGIGIACTQRSRDVMQMALLAAHDDEGGWQQQLREAFSLMYWGAEILQHERAAQRVGPGEPDGFLLERIWLHGIAGGGGAGAIADWTARYLTDIFAATGGTGEVLELKQDRPYALFVGLLADASVQGRWPEPVAASAMGAYGRLLASAGEPAAFRQALVSFCDFRLARAFGYDGMEGAQRGERSESVLDAGGWFQLYPAELLSLQYVYQETTGKPLSLQADHPLLDAAPMKLPALLPLHEDDLIRRAVGLARDAFGSAWRPVGP